jgi:hypothetical protein
LVVVLTDAFDVVGRVVVPAHPPDGILHEVSQAIEADRRLPDGRKIKGVHSHILLSSNMVTSASDILSGAQ